MAPRWPAWWASGSWTPAWPGSRSRATATSTRSTSGSTSAAAWSAGDWRRAVVFVRELVPRRAVAFVARWLYNEPYTAVPMRHELEMAGAADGQPGRAAYAWRLAGRWHRLEVRTRGRPALPDPASEAAFMTEHYWGYTVQRDGGSIEYRVAHPPWRVWDAEAAAFDCDVTAVYGTGFAECLGARPRSAFLAEGSAVAVHRGQRLERAVQPTFRR